MTVKRQQGFTLIESVVAMVIFAIAMVTLTSFLFPNIQKSGQPHYQVRASALAQSFLTKILAHGYDENSDPDGGLLRCNEAGQAACTAQASFGPDGAEVMDPKLYNDVDDYLGCWITNDASSNLCVDDSTPQPLSDVLGNDISDAYPNFAVNVHVVYETISGTEMKKINVEVSNLTYGSVTLVGYRGNY